MKRGWIVGCLYITALAAQQSSLDEARQLISRGANAQAERVLRTALATNAQNADARQLLGNLLALEGRRRESIEQLTELVRLRPNSAAAYNALGMALSRFVELKLAREAFERALQLDPNMAEAHLNLALIDGQENRLDAALEHLARTVVLQGKTPQAAYTHYLRAKVFSAQGDFAQAATELETAVALRPAYSEAWSALGSVRRAMLDGEAARTAYERAIASDPANAEARYQLGQELLREGKAREAVQHLEAARKLGRQDTATLYSLQLALRRAGRTKEADQVAETAKRLLKTSDAQANQFADAVRLNIEGLELEKSGDLRLAIEKYRAALELDPQHAGFRMNLGLALCRVGRWAEGADELREVVRLDPDNGEATRALYIAVDEAAKTPGGPSSQR